MAVEMGPRLEAFEIQARRAYEMGRVQRAAARAMILSTVVFALAWASLGRASLVVVPLPVFVWTLLGWRGGALLRGGQLGLVAGVATLLLPLSLLRSCCRVGMASMGSDCCTRPSVCVLVGAVLGLSLAWWVPRGAGARRLETSGGMMLGMASIAAFRCRGLFFGESLGLLGGLAGGILVAGFGVALLDRRRSAAA